MRVAAVSLFALIAAGALFSQDGPPTASQRPSFIRIHPLLSALDTDHDGIISSAELSRAPEVLAKLDANKDGVITPDELRPQGFGRRPEGGRPGGPGEARPPEASDLVKTLMTFDANGDGKLARTEVPERMQGLFDGADANKDDVLTSDELTKLADAQQQSAGQGGRRGEFGRGGPGGPGGPGGRGMRMDRVMQALDTDHDGKVSADEIRTAATSLKALDTNQDGQITEDEVRPNFGRPGGDGFNRDRGIADRAADAIMAASDAVDGTVVNIGGDIVVRGTITEAVDIRDPRADADNDPSLTQLMVHEAAIATSGSYRRGFDIAGRHYSHIIDPRTGRPADEIISATVEASDSATAGALATAFSVMTPQQSANLAEQFRDVDYLIVKRDGSLYASNAWRHLTMPILAPASAAPQAPAAKLTASDWNPAFELIVNLALARVEDPRYRRPYVAVWIEDKDKFPVRTLALWYEKPRWLPDLKSWYRDDRLRALAEGTEISHSVSSATRPPGRYTLRWDGKDNKGKLVLAGKYTVCVEATREHGTYQLTRQDLEFTGVPKQVQLPANTEVESVSLDYRKVSR